MKHNVSMVSIADRLGISVSEVSRAFKVGYPMNPEKRELIKRTAEEMGYVRNEVASRLSRKPLTVCIVISDTYPDFDREIMRGFEDAERIYSAYKLICKYELLSDSCRDSFAARLEAIFENAVSSGADGVVVSMMFDGMDEIIKRYSSRIKIALVNCDLPDSGRLFAAVNNIDAVAKIAAQLLAERAGAGRCAVFTGVADHWAHINIRKSFEEAARAEGLDIAAVYASPTEEIMRTQLEEAFAKHPDITSVYATSAVSIPICEYIHKHGLRGKVAVVTSDVYARLAKYIEDGTVAATLYQNPSWQAYSALEGMYRYIAYGTVPCERMVAKPEIVMRSNISLYL